MSNPLSVLVIGAGPTGLVLAHELARRGIAVRIVDRLRRPLGTSRAVSLNPRTLELLATSGIADTLRGSGQPVARGSILSSGRRVARIDFRTLPSPFPYLLAVPQSRTEAALEAALAGHGVKVERGTTLDDLAQDERSVLAQLTRDTGGTEAVRADWLVACDGVHSTVRHLLGIGFAQASQSATFVLADLEIRGNLAPDAFRIHATPDGMLAFFPLPDGRWRLIADLPPPPGDPEAKRRAGDQQRIPPLSELQALVDARAGGVRLDDPQWGATFRVHQRGAAALRERRVFLAGDAGHTHGIIGGEGVNAGIQDAFNLAWKLALAVEGVAGADFLHSYAAERMPANRHAFARTDWLTRLAGPRSRPIRLARDLLLPTVLALRRRRRSLAAEAADLAPDYRASPIVQATSGRSGPRPGDRAPDATCVRAEDAAAMDVFALLAGGGHLLLLAACGPRESGATNALLAWWAQLGHLAGTSNAAWIEAGAEYGRTPAAFVVRPDGTIAARAPIAAARTALATHFRTVYGRASA